MLKGGAFPQLGRQSRFGVLPFEDFDATVWTGRSRAEQRVFSGYTARPDGRNQISFSVSSVALKPQHRERGGSQ
jgi:hypothetical protein